MMADPGASPVAQNVAIGASARCAVHRDVAATAVCSRCGDYHCADCHKLVAGRALCASCRALPGIDYLEETRLRFWGKRDVFVWWYGVFGLLTPLGVLAALAVRPASVDRLQEIGNVLMIPVSIAYLLLWRPARAGLVAVSALQGLISVARIALGVDITRGMTPAQLEHAQAMGGMPTMTALTVASMLVGVLLSIAAYQSSRNKLAFKIDVDERALQRLYGTYVGNSLALRAAWYSVLGFIPFASVVPLGMGIVALRRVDERAWPPRGGRTAAVIGVVASSLFLLGWIGVCVALFLSSRGRGAH